MKKPTNYSLTNHMYINLKVCKQMTFFFYIFWTIVLIFDAMFIMFQLSKTPHIVENMTKDCVYAIPCSRGRKSKGETAPPPQGEASRTPEGCNT